MNIFIEITTMDKKLITKQQRKIKLAIKLYPMSTFKLINEQQFYNFLSKDNVNLVKEAIAS